MSETLRVSIIVPDRPGVITAIAGALFDAGVNLADTSYAVLGEAAEFTAVCETPKALDALEVKRQLGALEVLEGAEIEVHPFVWGAAGGERAHITHELNLQGQDQPGLIARITEALADYGANIVHMETHRSPGDGSYWMRLAVGIPPDRTEACLAAVTNSAALLEMNLGYQRIGETPDDPPVEFE